MPREFKLPDVGEGVHEGELVEWLVEPGDTVAEDQPVAKVETDKALVDVPSSVNGTVRELRWEEGDVVPVGDVLLVFNVEGEDDEAIAAGETEGGETEGGEASGSAAESAGGGAAADAGESGGEPAQPEAESPPPAGSPEAAEAASASDSGRVFAAPSARRIARELGVNIHAVEGSGPGGRVTEQDVRAAAEAAEEPAAAEGDAGTAETPEVSLESEEGAAGGIEAAVDAGMEGDAGTTGQTGPAATQQTAEPEAAADRDRTLAAPATRRLAEEQGVDLDAVPATEERDGEPFVTPEAVVEYAEAQQQAQAADAEAVEAGGPSGATEAAGTAQPPASQERSERREPYRGVRRTIGEAMAESKYTAPHVTHHDEVDVTELVDVKQRLAERAEERGIKLTYMPFVLKAVTAALKEYPVMNAALDEDAGEIVYKEYYDLGIATATDVGLMVPVLQGVDRKGLLQLASEMDELVEKARERTIAPEELRGSTFSVTNVGAIGGEYATPILNYPEVGILALGQIRRKPRVVEDEDGNESIEPRSILPLSLSIDHRIVDGAIAAQFTNEVMQYLENPELLLLE
ncbi:branched-chain alpha-keto acid dehydrogenase subunit E2 [Salinarchaeum sp. Harcht-Bsk1]|uniref:2-oxo acid dehydrogenase subunit E2 n=1 Tax=Salinarchaeum sp. Harcht-Bsk1 TaxID=1333523 RepID=UPI00034239E9|nr:2-oxo acid dehydrogenase subunit E2 [Salinarchaeum sp. Harcht-Bsk1]AGN01835.1 branched-chain alpha-keto acid dehydrogenase subunit E2 [Salinarchaeum sp. Harcht-Bsk1]